MMTNMTVLCVDDEKPMLSSIKRFLVSSGYNVQTAESGQAGLEILSNEPIDIVISDMRMPEMKGDEFLMNVAQNYPDTIRILLTGQSDQKNTINAINHGKIHHFFEKPWDRDLVVATLKILVEHLEIKREKSRLEKLNAEQNIELAALNSQLSEVNGSLEKKVVERTDKLAKARSDLEHTYTDLQKTYQDTVMVFTHLIDARKGQSRKSSRDIARLATLVAQALGLAPQQVEQVHYAGLLYNIGKIGFTSHLLNTAYADFDEEQLAIFNQYPALGEASLLALNFLNEAAQFIAAHQERLNGSGYPNQLKNDQIPLGAQILGIAVEYYQLQEGLVANSQYGETQAKNYIESKASEFFNPDVVEAFSEVIESLPPEEIDSKEPLAAWELRAGMVLARDLLTPGGRLLLTKDSQLVTEVIERLVGLEDKMPSHLLVYIK
jgi:response regulator RpfG family c-di-GMP phosphodiesterase